MKRHRIWGILFILAGILTASNTLINGSVGKSGNSAYAAGELTGALLIPSLLIIAGVIRLIKNPKIKGN